MKIVLIVVAVAVLGPCVLGVAAAIILPAIARSVQQSKIARCQSNLQQLDRMMNAYRAQFGGQYPPSTGAEFWQKLRQTASPDVFQCPLEGSPATAGTDYRGPTDDPTLYGDGDPIGADLP